MGQVPFGLLGHEVQVVKGEEDFNHLQQFLLRDGHDLDRRGPLVQLETSDLATSLRHWMMMRMKIQKRLVPRPFDQVPLVQIVKVLLVQRVAH